MLYLTLSNPVFSTTVTHIFNDNAFFAPQYSVGRLSMNSICSNYDDGQVLIINYVS